MYNILKITKIDHTEVLQQRKYLKYREIVRLKKSVDNKRKNMI